MKFTLSIILILISHFSAAEEWLSIDESVKSNYSAKAATMSDHFLAFSHFFPIYGIMQTKESDLRMEVASHYFISETLNYSLTFGVKRWAKRRRPYTYNSSPEAMEFASHNVDDQTRSFYSGHTSYTMVAARSFSQTIEEEMPSQKRALLLFASYFNASSVAALRVVSGRHFYSDVFVGAIAAIALCELTIQFQPDRSRFYRLKSGDYISIASGLVSGFVWPILLNFEKKDSTVMIEPVITGHSSEVRLTWSL